MKVQVKFRCGHSEVVRLFGTDEEIDLQAKSMSDKCVCPLCALTAYDKPPYVSFETAMVNAGRMRLPSLEGSFGQIKWAMTIRAQVLALSDNTLWFLCYQEGKTLGAIPKYHDQCELYFGGPHDQEPNSVRRFVWDAVVDQTDATWWIAGKDHCARELINAYLRQSCDYTLARVKQNEERWKLQEAMKNFTIAFVQKKQQTVQNQADDEVADVSKNEACILRFMDHPDEIELPKCLQEEQPIEERQHKTMSDCAESTTQDQGDNQIPPKVQERTVDSETPRQKTSKSRSKKKNKRRK